MSNIAIIPARGGSKRIYKKNIRDFFGKPIISYSIETAIKSNLFEEVIVSTEDVEIAEIAIKYGATVPFLRSLKNSNDFATTVDVIIEVLNWYKLQGKTFKVATCIYPCSPFITLDLLNNSILKIQESNIDCVFPVVAYSHPIQRALKINESGKIQFFDLNQINTRTQDLDKTYYDAGMFYTFNVPLFYHSMSLRTENTVAIELNELQAHDIDSEIDWLIAEMKYKLFTNAKL